MGIYVNLKAEVLESLRELARLERRRVADQGALLLEEAVRAAVPPKAKFDAMRTEALEAVQQVVGGANRG